METSAVGGTDRQRRPLVSVVIPTRNRAQLLPESLASVQAQEGVGDQFEIEVIVVDDASSDATPEVVRRHSGVRYIRLPTNRGLPAAQNVGIKASSGRYVAFLDDDDVWLPYKLRLQVPVLEENPLVGVAYSQQIVVFGNNVDVWPHARDARSGSVFRALLMGNFVGQRGILVRREAFEKAGYFDESLPICEDYDMWLRLAFHFPFAFVAGPVAIYHVSIGGMYVTAIAQGHTQRERRRVVERALAMIPDTGREYAELKREALVRAELEFCRELEFTGELDRMRAHLLKTLGEFPWMVGEPWARSLIQSLVRRLTMASDAPIAMVQAFFGEVRGAVSTAGLRERLGIRRLLADLWWDVAVGLRGIRSPQRDRDAGYAAARAFVYGPSKLGRTLVHLLVRGMFGPRADRIRAVLRQGVL